MGKVSGYRNFTAAAVTSAALIAGNGVTILRGPGETCVHVPKGVAALSEPGFSSLKADHIQIEGALGWHYPYNGETGEVTAMQRLWAQLVVGVNQKKFGDLIEPADLVGTTQRLFFVRSPDATFDHQLVDWTLMQAVGYEIKSTSDVLVPCT